MMDQRELKEKELLLKKISGRLSGIHKDDLSIAERQIVNILVDSAFLTYDADNNVVEVD